MNCEICGVRVKSWSAAYIGDVPHCKKCFGSTESQKYMNTKSSNSETPKKASETNPRGAEAATIEILCYLIAGLSLLSGVILCLLTWPAKNSYSGELAALSYASPFIWLFAGLVHFTLFSALGKILNNVKALIKN